MIVSPICGGPQPEEKPKDDEEKDEEKEEKDNAAGWDVLEVTWLLDIAAWL